MLHTLSRRRDLIGTWHPPFRDGFLDVMSRAGRAIAEADQEPIQGCLSQLDEVVTRVEAEDAIPTWPVYGSLLVNLRNILDAMEEVAAANPMSQPPLPFIRR